MKGRRWRIPAFGEWNHHYADAAVVEDDDWSLTSESFESAMWAAVPAYEPIKRARAARRCKRIPAFGQWNTADSNHRESKGDCPAAITPCLIPAKPWIPRCTAKEITTSGGTSMGKQKKAEVIHGTGMGRVATGSISMSKPYYFSVVQGRSDDNDLYKVPPDMLHRKPMKVTRVSWLRCLLMGCFRGPVCTA